MSTSNDIKSTQTSIKLPALTVNIGALTTAFNPPEDCTSLTLIADDTGTGRFAAVTILDFIRGYECPPPTDNPKLQLVSSCYPERWAPAVNNIIHDWEGPNAVYPVFSPGLMCPSGYETACTMVYSQPGAMETAGPSSLSTWSVLAKGETGYGCCLSGYSCYTPYMCISTPSVSATITADMSKDCPNSTSWSRTTTTEFIDSTIVPFVLAPQLVLIQRASSAGTTETKASGPPPTSGVSPDNDTPAGLSTALKAAIGTAVPLILIILALAGYIVYRRRNRNKNPAQAASEQEDSGGGGGLGLPDLNKPELDATPSPFGLSLGPGSELDGTPRPSPGIPSPGADSTLVGGRVSELPGSESARVMAAMCELPGDEEFAQSLPQPKEMHQVVADDKDDNNPLDASMEAAPELRAHHTSDRDAEKSDLVGEDG